MRDLEGKIALVTGGAKGVGKVISRQLAARGAHVLVNFFHSLEAAKRTKAELEAAGAKVDLVRGSVAQLSQVERMFAEIEEKHGHLDILVNNAASGAFVASEGVTEEYFDRALDTNLKGSFWCARKAAPLMAGRGGGVIVNVSSIGADQVIANYLVVGTSKAGVESLTRYLAVEYAPLNIRVNTASATMLEGDVSKLFPRYEEMREVHVGATPLGRLGTEQDLAGVVMFLTSEQSRWVTGQTILADGGLSLNSRALSPPPIPAAAAQPPVLAAAAPPAPAVPASDAAETEDIAVVGMGLVVPGAKDPEEYWKVLMEGPNLFRSVPKERWDNGPFFSADQSQEDKTYQSKSVFITDMAPEGAAQADPESPELTTLWLRHALRQALQGVKRQHGERVSFVVGYTADGSQHLEEALVLVGARHRFEEALAQSDIPDSEKPALSEAASAALRARYWRGAAAPSRFLPHQVGRNAMEGVLPEDTELQMVDTACSSSLYAVDIGMKGLLMGRHDVAVCGGSFALAPRGSVLFAKLHGLSESGEARPLDKSCDGVVFADGAGVVVLKRLKKALADGDRVLGVIKAFGSSSDGKGKAIYAPSSAGQSIAIERALSHPAADLKHIDWVVAHATGTPAGDLAEFTTIREKIVPDRPVCVTSNKSLIGHTGWAAGVSSLIEVLLGLEKQAIPPQHKFSAPPADFEVAKTNLRIPTAPVPWLPKGDAPRAASISSFGFGGTNAHLIVEEYAPEKAAPAPAPARAYGERVALVGWSAHVPGLDTREAVSAWLSGGGREPEPTFGDAYPMPSFEKVRMPPATVRTIDRCQLMVLECAHDLKRWLGGFWDASRERTGVFMGHMGATRTATLYGGRCYLDDIRQTLQGSERLRRSPHLGALLDGVSREVKRFVPASNENSFPGMMPNVIPARIANYFDLKGPNMTIDTGFSSALSAFEVAGRYLRSGELRMALVGGINGNTTLEMRHILRDLAPGQDTDPAEGAFLFALATEATATEAGLPILAFVDDLTMADAAGTPAQGGDPLPTGPCRSYLGAEGAIAVLRALHAGQPETTITCRDAAQAPAVRLRLLAPDAAEKPATAEAPRVPAPYHDEAHHAPGKPLEVKRHVVVLEESPLQPVRHAIDFFAPGTVILTDRPELLASLEGVPADAVVLSTRPVPPALRNGFYLPEVTPEAVERLAREVEGPVAHLRVLADLGASAPPPSCLWEEPASLVALHDLAFLALQQFHGSLSGRPSSFAALLLNALPAGAPHPFAGLFGGMVKSTALELLPDCRAYAVFTSAADVREGIRQAQAESAAKQFLPVVVYQDGVRKTFFLDETPGDLPENAAARLGPDSVVVATAGARGITAELLKALAHHFRPRLYLIGSNRLDRYPPDVFTGSDEEFAKRRPAFIREQKAAHPDKPLGQVNREFDRIADARAARRNIEEMARHSGPNNVHYIACDVMDREGLARAIGEIVSAEGRVDLVVSAAGINRAASIPVKSFSDFRAVRDIKLKGYQNLQYALRDCPPRMWCSFGSFLGLTGQRGEIDYAAANDFLASSACYACQALGRDEFTIGWGLWSSVGLGADPLKKTFLEKSGLYTSMTTEEGIHHFVREVNLPRHDPSVIQLGAAERKAVIDYIPDFFAARTARQQVPKGTFYLGRVLARGEDEILFERVFDLEKDGYLDHHVVNGYATLPGTFVTEIAAEAAAQLVPGMSVVALEDAVFQHFLRVYDKSKPGVKKIHARVIERGEGQTVVRVRVLTDVVAPNGSVLTSDKLHFEIKVILSARVPPAPYWEAWSPAGETPVPDPYHFPAAPVHLTDLFVTTTDTRSHPLGKRAAYTLALSPEDSIFSSFLVPSLLLDGLARVAVLDFVEGDYIPLVAPARIRRIDLYESLNDCRLAETYDRIEMYVTPREFTHEQEGGKNRFVAVRPDGRIILQMKDVAGVVIGYVHRATGAFVAKAQVEELQRRRSALLAGAAS